MDNTCSSLTIRGRYRIPTVRKEAFERGEHLEDPEEEYDGKESNYYKNTDGSRKELVNGIKTDRAIKTLKGGPNVKGASIKAQERLGEDVTELQEELARLEANIQPVEEEIAELVEALVPYKDIQNGLKENRAKLKALQNSLVEHLVARKDALSDDEARDLVLGLMKEELFELDGFAKSGKDEVIELMTKLSDKYSITLADIEQSRDDANAKLEGFLKGWGMDNDLQVNLTECIDTHHTQMPKGWVCESWVI